MATPHLNCFAGEMVHPVLSRERYVVQCRIQGGLRPARDSKCCADYASCQIWQARKRLERNTSVQKKHADAMLREPHRHTLD